MTITEGFVEHKQYELVMGGRSEKTMEQYDNVSKLVVRFLGDVDIEDLDLPMVKDFFCYLSSWQKPNTVRGNMVCLRCVLKFLKTKGIDVMDSGGITIPKRKKTRIEYLTPEETHQFIEVIGMSRRGYSLINRSRNVAIAWLIATTGMRVSEVCALNKNSVRNREFTVIGKSRDPRIVFLLERVYDVIHEYLSCRTDSNRALFVSQQTGERITTKTVRRVFDFACKRSGFDGVHPHTLRHSFATHLLNQEVDLCYVADLLGHASLDTTKNYVHYANPRLSAVYSKAMANY